jgi:tetratricopeptide (TPR) repeat protein
MKPVRAAELYSLAAHAEMESKFTEAETLYSEALQAWEKSAGPESPALMKSLNGLGNILRVQGRRASAERNFRRAIAIGEKAGDPARLDLAVGLNSLGGLYSDEHRPSRAIPLLERALRIRDLALGPEDPLLASSLNNLADAYVEQHRLDSSEALYRRSLTLLTDPSKHPFLTAITNFKLAELLFRHGKGDPGNLSDAAHLYQLSLTILEKSPWQSHPLVGIDLRSLAEVYVAERRYKDVEPLLIRALAVFERTLGPQHPQVAKVLSVYAAAGRMHRGRQAAAMERRAKHIIRTFKFEDPDNTTVDVSTLKELR